MVCKNEPEIKSKHALKNTGEGATSGLGDSVPSVVVSTLAGYWDGSAGALSVKKEQP